MATDTPPPPAAPEAPAAPASPAPNAPSGGSAVPEPYYKALFQADGSLNHGALDKLPDHLAPLRETLSRQKDIDSMLRSYANAQTLASKKALAPLPPNAPAEVVAERKALVDSLNGVPPTPKDYGIARPKDVPENAWNQQLADGFAAWAHKHSVAPSAVKELLGQQFDAVKGTLAKQESDARTFWAGQEKEFSDQIRMKNIEPSRADELVQRGAVGLGLDINKESVQVLLKRSDVRMMALNHAMAVAGDTVVQADATSKEADPGTEAKDIMHNKANPMYEQYWNRDGKFPRSVQEAAKARVNELLALDAQRNGRAGLSSKTRRV
jgi:hypothetical protein